VARKGLLFNDQEDPVYEDQQVVTESYRGVKLLVIEAGHGWCPGARVKKYKMRIWCQW
jgi:hypothetical protein